MADNTSTSGWGKEMNAEAHIGTYDAFLTGVKFGGGFIILLLIGMAFFLL